MPSPRHLTVRRGHAEPLESIAPGMLDRFHDFDADLRPEYDAELVADQIIVTPRGLNGPGDRVFSEISRQIILRASIKAEISARRGIATPFGCFIPDLTAAERGTFEGAPSWGIATGILLVAEVGDSQLDIDREWKRRAYAASGIPLYLLVDYRFWQTVLFSDPDVEVQDYRADVRVPFGRDLTLPAPFDFTLTDFTPRG